MSKVFIRYSPGFLTSFTNSAWPWHAQAWYRKHGKSTWLPFFTRKRGEIQPKKLETDYDRPCLGKHFEKVLLFQLKKIRGINPDNHAYIEDKSCLTAIIELLEFFRSFKTKSALLKKEGCLLIPILMAEDIGSAFESLDHLSMQEIICRKKTYIVYVLFFSVRFFSVENRKFKTTS